MTPVEAARLLAVCAQNWTTMQVAERTTEIWAQALATTDAAHAQAAVQALIRSDEYPPTVAQIIAVARGYARRPDGPAALPAPRHTTPGGDIARAIKAALAAVDRPQHRGCSAGTCPACTTRAERVAQFTEVNQALREADLIR